MDVEGGYDERKSRDGLQDPQIMAMSGAMGGGIPNNKSKSVETYFGGGGNSRYSAVIQNSQQLPFISQKKYDNESKRSTSIKQQP